MELKDFIHQCLVDICGGIGNAQKEISKTTGNVPIAPAFIDGKPVFHRESSSIDFDISISVTDLNTHGVSGEVGSKGIIKVIGIDVGVDGKMDKSKTTEHQSRIKFSIPFYPQALNRKE